MDSIKERLTQLELTVMDLERFLEDLNTEFIRQTKVVERLERENKVLKESLENNIKLLSEETPPPHY
jgi:uncharacterized coiled-coil protein SlyX